MSVAMMATVLCVVWWKETCTFDLQDKENLQLPTMSVTLHAIHFH
jgi:hypothetical protein